MKAEDSLETVEMTTDGSLELAVIWLHGLGADGYDFVPIVEELRMPFGVRFVFPHAPVRSVTINSGAAMRAWYDLLGFGGNVPEDAAGIRASAAAIRRLIDREIERGMRSERVVLAGFSQGGAIALHVGLREPRCLAGVLALSTYLPLASALAAEKSEQSAALPIFLAHGTDDPIVAFSFAERSRQWLERHGFAVDWHVYPMAHSVCAQEIRDIGTWLAALPERAGPDTVGADR